MHYWINRSRDLQGIHIEVFLDLVRNFIYSFSTYFRHIARTKNLHKWLLFRSFDSKKIRRRCVWQLYKKRFRVAQKHESHLPRSPTSSPLRLRSQGLLRETDIRIFRCQSIARLSTYRYSFELDQPQNRNRNKNRYPCLQNYLWGIPKKVHIYHQMLGSLSSFYICYIFLLIGMSCNSKDKSSILYFPNRTLQDTYIDHFLRWFINSTSRLYRW